MPILSHSPHPKHAQAYLNIDTTLFLGQAVSVRWTNTNHFYHARGVVDKINPKTVLVVLTETITDPCDGSILYPLETPIKVPRFGMRGWTSNNTVDTYEEA